MSDKYIKLEELTNNVEKVKEIFNGTQEEIMAKLAAEGIELTADEFDSLIKGALSVVNMSEVLSDDELEAVSGGCSKCESVGKKIGRIIGKILYQIFGNR